jgi:serine/threonine protein kinase
VSQFDRWKEVAPIVLHALELQPSEVGAYLEQVCGGDADLRTKAAALLAVSTSARAVADEFLAAGTRSLLQPGSVVDHHTIISGPLGRPGMGEVYLADDTKLGRPVALKVLPRSLGPRYQNEHKKLANLNHPNIVKVFASGLTPDGSVYFTMEFVDGVPITVYCVQHNLPLEGRLHLFQVVCEAVRYVHTGPYVHCDLKPSNILVDRDGVVKVLDFGIAKIVSESGSPQEVTKQEERRMSIPFASPEQVAYKVLRTPSDIYSLGVLLCLLIAEHLPYRGETDDAIRQEILAGDVRKPSDVAPRQTAKDLKGDLDGIVLKCLRMEPDQRFYSPEALAGGIEEFLDHRPVTALQGSYRYRTRKFIRRNWKRSLVAGVLLVVALIGGRQWWQSHEEALREAVVADQQDDFINKTLALYNPANVKDFRELLDDTGNNILAHISDPAAQVHLLNTLGRTFQNAALNDGAVRWHEKALEIAKRKLGPTHLLVAESLDYLGVVARIRGDLPGSERLLRSAIAIRQPQVAATDTSFTHELFQLGTTIAHEGRDPEAERLQRRALDLRRQAVRRPDASREDFEGYAQSLFAVGIILAENNKELDRAERYLRLSLAIRQRIYEEKDPLTTNTLGGLVKVLDKRGRLADAVRLQREVASRYHEVYSPDNPQAIVADVNLGDLLRKTGSLDEAATVLEGALEHAKAAQSLGPHHPTTVGATLHLARVRLGQGRLTDAETHVSQAADWLRHTAIPDPLTMGKLALAQGECAQAKGNDILAETSYRKALEIFGHLQGYEGYLTLEPKTKLGNLMLKSGRFADAERLLVAVHKQKRDRDSARDLVRLYTAWNRPDKTAAYEKLLK